MNTHKIKRPESRGITLIALVITIIVLLILAGVSIATLIGENGILTQAEETKNKTTEAESIERIKVEVVGSYGIDGKIDKEQLNKNLKNVEDLTYGEQALSDSNKIANLPAIVRLNGYNITIKSNGVVEKTPEGIDKIIANPTEYYGKKVTNYKANENDTNTYRIFYVDKENYFKDGANTIYLKADYSEKRIVCSTEYDSLNTKVRTMNPEWAKGKADSDTKTRGESEFDDPKSETKKVTWNLNEQAAAWLCSPVNEKNYLSSTPLPWNEYYNQNHANYVIGGPSVEMYIKSYNQAYSNITDFVVYTLGTNYRDTAAHGYIYTLTGSDYSTGNNSLNCTEYNSMYSGKDGSNTGDWWLSSPCAESVHRMCFVYGHTAMLDRRNYASENRSSISPLISLKSSFIPEVEE